MESEWSWFAASVRSALLRPRAFARTLPREHYGLAGILVAVAVGFALSVAVDAAVLFSKRLDPLTLVSRLAVDALFLGVRFAIVTALIAALARGLVTLRGSAISLDQCFTALSFAMTPLIASPIVPAMLFVANELDGVARGAALLSAGALALALLGRVIVSTALNLGALAGLARAIVIGALTLLAAGLILQDQIARAAFTALTYAPAVLPPPATVASDGSAASADGLTLRLPPEWRDTARGIPGEVGRFETAESRLVVRRAAVAPLTTADGFAGEMARDLMRDFTRVESTERRLVNIDGVAAIDDRWYGMIGEVRIAQRQYTLVLGRVGYQVEFRFFMPADEMAALQGAADIAASIRIAR